MAALATPSGRIPLLTDAARRGLESPVFRWSIAPAVLAWIGLIALSAQGFEPAFCLSAKTDPLQGLLAALGAGLSGFNPATVILGWGLMLTAMMAPLLAPMIAYVAARSFADRRERSVGIFFAGYAGVWIVVTGVAFFVLLLVHTLVVHTGLGLWAGLLGGGAAAIWQLSSTKQRALNRCHGVRPLRASGGAADADAFNFGALHGSRCVRACAPTMFLTMIGAHALTVMAAVFAVLLAERTALRPRQSAAAVLLLLAGALSMPAV